MITIPASDLIILHNGEGNSNKVYVINVANKITAYGRVGKPLKIEQTDKDIDKLKASKIKKGYAPVSAKLVGLEDGLMVPAELVDVISCEPTDGAECAADLFPVELKPLVEELAKLTGDEWLNGYLQDDGGKCVNEYIVIGDARNSCVSYAFKGQPAMDGTLWDMIPDSIMDKAPASDTSGEGDLQLIAISTSGEVCKFVHDEWKNYEGKEKSEGWNIKWHVGIGDGFFELKNYGAHDQDSAEYLLRLLDNFTRIDPETLNEEGIVELANYVLEGHRIEAYGTLTNDVFCKVEYPDFDDDEFVKKYTLVDVDSEEEAIEAMNDGAYLECIPEDFWCDEVFTIAAATGQYNDKSKLPAKFMSVQDILDAIDDNDAYSLPKGSELTWDNPLVQKFIADKFVECDAADKNDKWKVKGKIEKVFGFIKKETWTQAMADVYVTISGSELPKHLMTTENIITSCKNTIKGGYNYPSLVFKLSADAWTPELARELVELGMKAVPLLPEKYRTDELVTMSLVRGDFNYSHVASIWDGVATHLITPEIVSMTLAKGTADAINGIMSRVDASKISQADLSVLESRMAADEFLARDVWVKYLPDVAKTSALVEAWLESTLKKEKNRSIGEDMMSVPKERRTQKMQDIIAKYTGEKHIHVPEEGTCFLKAVPFAEFF